MANRRLVQMPRERMRAFGTARARDGSLEAALDVGRRFAIVVMWDRMTHDQREEWMAYGRELCYPRRARKVA